MSNILRKMLLTVFGFDIVFILIALYGLEAMESKKLSSFEKR